MMVLERDQEEAFNRIYHQYYSLVYYTAYKVLNDAYMAQDVVQETFINVYSHLHTIRQQKNKAAWIKTISRNKAIDYYRRRAVRNEILDDLIESIGVVEDETDSLAEKSALHELLYTLEPQYRQSLLLVYEQGFTYEQLAAYQNTTVSAVKSKLHRAKKKLRLMVGEDGLGMLAVDRYA
ncbi:RNA polymerase sigma factor [Paenibacillus sp. NPDC058174]|uniref:RNA polymerase sigma factor n=1 Tax=Paenibacillus sp. NPDC058174 TaxID=3346366 RepID=UPI0036D79ED6